MIPTYSTQQKRTVRITVTIVILIFFVINVIEAQGILNTEKYEQNLQKKFGLSGTFSYEGARGNSNLNKTDFEMLMNYHTGDNIFRLVGGFNYLNSTGDAITSSIYSQLRYNRIYTKRLQSFTFLQIQKNDILLVKARELAGAGLRIALIRKDSAKIKFDIGLGGMYEHELLNGSNPYIPADAAHDYFRMSDFLSFRYRHKNISIIDVMYYQPLMTRFSDFRYYNDLSLQFRIKKYLFFETGFVYRYDSRPPGNIKTADMSVKNGIVFNF